jgi:hypothetical protein
MDALAALLFARDHRREYCDIVPVSSGKRSEPVARWFSYLVGPKLYAASYPAYQIVGRVS